MKKQLTAIVLLFALVLSMAGCSTANAVQKLDAAEDRVEAKLDAAEERLEANLRKAAAPETVPAAPAAPVREAPAAVPEEPAGPAEAPVAPAETQPVTLVPAPAEKAQALTGEEAQKIALDHLGLTAGQVTRLHTEYEIDDGIPQFDVSFYQGDWEYEFEIHAETGKILSHDKDHKYD